MDNLFLKIARKEEPSYSIYENDQIYAFLDIEPVSAGHTLIVPKTYCPDIESLEPEMAAAILIAAKKVVTALRNLYGYEGIVIHQVNGEKAQDIRHFHMHVYGTLPKNAEPFYKELHQEPDEKEKIFQKISEKMSKFILKESL